MFNKYMYHPERVPALLHREVCSNGHNMYQASSIWLCIKWKENIVNAKLVVGGRTINDVKG